MFRPESLTLEWVIGALVGFLAIMSALVLMGLQTWYSAMLTLLLKLGTVLLVQRRT